MMSYRFKRRSFMQGVGAAVGLKTMLRNLEAGAQGAKSPPRLLVTHWPVGLGYRPDFIPTAANNTGSVNLKPFADAGLSADMTVFNGFHINYPGATFGGGHESGTVKMMTGLSTPGTRAGELESDDAFSGGPSFDQIFLKDAPVLQTPGLGYANSICDSRVDFVETSTQCLSYGYTTGNPGAGVSLGTGPENTPLLPVLSPVAQWMNLFSGVVPGGAGGAGGTSGVNVAMLKALREKKSVLDYALAELAQLKTLAPAGEAGKIDIHAAAIRQIENQLASQIQAAQNGGGGASGGGGRCTVPAQPAAIVGQTFGKTNHNDYGNPTTTVADDTTHKTVAQLHFGILQAAMVCDLIRVATFQYSPGTNHVSFQGQFPGEAATIYMHHPESHKIGTADTEAATLGAGPGGALGGNIAKFLSNVQTWYYTLHASLLAGMKTTLDGMGNNLFDNTIIPFVTEVRATGHEWNNMAAMMFGGKALGFQQGTYKALNNVPLASLWTTVAQGFGLAYNAAPLNTEKFAMAGSYPPIAGLWIKPP